MYLRDFIVEIGTFDIVLLTDQVNADYDYLSHIEVSRNSILSFLDFLPGIFQPYDVFGALSSAIAISRINASLQIANGQISVVGDALGTVSSIDRNWFDVQIADITSEYQTEISNLPGFGLDEFAEGATSFVASFFGNVADVTLGQLESIKDIGDFIVGTYGLISTAIFERNSIAVSFLASVERLDETIRTVVDAIIDSGNDGYQLSDFATVGDILVNQMTSTWNRMGAGDLISLRSLTGDMIDVVTGDARLFTIGEKTKALVDGYNLLTANGVTGEEGLKFLFGVQEDFWLTGPSVGAGDLFALFGMALQVVKLKGEIADLSTYLAGSGDGQEFGGREIADLTVQIKNKELLQIVFDDLLPKLKFVLAKAGLPPQYVAGAQAFSESIDIFLQAQKAGLVKDLSIAIDQLEVIHDAVVKAYGQLTAVLENALSRLPTNWGNDTPLERVVADGNHIFYGTDFSERIIGSEQNDTISAGGGRDTVYGGRGLDTLYGGSENDVLLGEADNDLLHGDGNDDTLYGGGQSDTLYGDEGNDLLKGEAGTDTLYGGLNNDEMYGDEEGDLLFGESGNDTLYGGSGNDTLDGGADADTLKGESGSDQFVFAAAAVSDARAGTFDTISDYDQGNARNGIYFAGEGDIIDLTAAIADLYPALPASLIDLVRAQRQDGWPSANLDIKDAQGKWLTIARLDGIQGGHTLKLKLDPTNTTVTTDITVAGIATTPKSTWTITPTATSVAEGGVVTFTIARSNWDTEETVYLSTTINKGSLNDGDYKPWLNSKITFAAGNDKPYVASVITLDDDIEAEGNELHGFIVQTDPSHPASKYEVEATFMIIDDDVYVDPGVGESWKGTSIAETRYGTAGHDYYNGFGGDDVLYGYGGNDGIAGGSGNDYLSGGSGNDYLYDDEGGNDTLRGGSGNDYLQVQGPGADVIDGGAGLDTLYLNRPDLTANVTLSVVSDGDGTVHDFSLPDGTTVSGIELLNLATGSGDDHVTFANTTAPGRQGWSGGAGNDTAVLDFSAFGSAIYARDEGGNYYGAYFSGDSSARLYLHSVENVWIYGGAGNDGLNVTSGTNALFGNDGDDNLTGGSGNDYLSGGSGNDYLYDDEGGNDTLRGGSGNDNLQVQGPGADVIDGGAGLDTLQLSRSDLTVGVVVSVVSDGNGSTYEFGLPDGTTVSDVELLNLSTGSGDDQVTFANTTIAGQQTWGDYGGIDRAVVDFSAFSTAVTGSYANNYYFIDTQSDAYQVRLYGVENVTIYGGTGNDNLSRSSVGGANALYGNDGDDTLTGSSGSDSLSGGSGNDSLGGGSGDDQAVYVGNRSSYSIARVSGGFSVTDMAGNEGVDTIVGIEALVFAEGKYTLDADGNLTYSNNTAPTGSVTISGTTTQGQTLTASNTLADADGLRTIAYQWNADGTAIAGATGSLFVLTQSQVGKAITVTASYTDGHGTLESVASDATSVVIGGNSGPTGSVSITGTPTQGQTLTASNTLADADGLGPIAYQWLADGTAIAGATGSTLVLEEEQVGKAITLTASYTDGRGTAEALTSGPTSLVANVNDFPTGSVTIAGTPTQGQTLTASNTLGDADGLGTIAYQWLADGSVIAGATGNSLVLAEAQVGKAITVTASYTDGHGTAESVPSAATSLVANLNDAPTGSVTIAGTPTQGQTLTAANTLADADALGAIAYRWLADGSVIAGATASTLALAEAQVGKTISVKASYTDGHGTPESLTSNATATVANVNDAPTGAVTIAGTATQGQTLTAANTLADADGLGTIAYQWNVDGTAIAGATGSALVLTQSQVGKAITVTASYTDGHGTLESVASGATGLVTGVSVNTPPTGAVTISGTATQGQTLTAANTLADADGLGTIAYQWLADGSLIAGATASTFVLAEAQVGKAITVTASYLDGLGTVESVASAATGTVLGYRLGTSGGDTLVGTSYADVIYGLAGKDNLSGNGGNDRLDGGAGADTMLGGAGNDTYVVDNASDKVLETTTAKSKVDAGGTDTVESSVTWTLGDFVENLTLTGSANIDGSGNTLANTLRGNDGANTLYGLAGNDTLNGGAGNDELFGGASNDELFGDAGNDKLLGGPGSDTLDGGAGIDLLLGGSGNDLLTGGLGSDIFRFDDTALNASTNVDTLLDFQAGYDSIQLENAVFRKLSATRALSAANFRASADGMAADANDYILYDTDSGALYYDADGSGKGAAIQFATVVTVGTMPLSATDFIVT